MLPLDRFEHVLLYAGAVAASVTVRGSLSSAATRRHRDELGEDLYRFALFHAPLIAAPNAACAFDTQADLTRATVLSAGATLATSYALPFPGRLARRIETKVGALVPVPTPRIDLPGVERLLERLLKQLESSWHQRMVRVSAPGL